MHTWFKRRTRNKYIKKYGENLTDEQIEKAILIVDRNFNIFQLMCALLIPIFFGIFIDNLIFLIVYFATRETRESLHAKNGDTCFIWSNILIIPIQISIFATKTYYSESALTFTLCVILGLLAGFCLSESKLNFAYCGKTAEKEIKEDFNYYMRKNIDEPYVVNLLERKSKTFNYLNFARDIYIDKLSTAELMKKYGYQQTNILNKKNDLLNLFFHKI